MQFTTQQQQDVDGASVAMRQQTSNPLGDSSAGSGSGSGSVQRQTSNPLGDSRATASSVTVANAGQLLAANAAAGSGNTQEELLAKINERLDNERACGLLKRKQCDLSKQCEWEGRGCCGGGECVLKPSLYP